MNQMRDKIYTKLSSLLKTYHGSIPGDNTTFPVCSFWISKGVQRTGDDSDLDFGYILNIEAFISLDGDETIFETIESEIRNINHPVGLMDVSDMPNVTDKIGVSYLFEIIE